MRDIERSHKVYFNDGLEGIDAHAMEDRIPQDAGVVYDPIELAVGIDRHLDDFTRGQSFSDGFEIRNRSAPALLDLVDDFFGRCRTIARTVRVNAGVIYNNFGTLGGTEKGDLAADAAARASDDDDLVGK
jgi:hypothetical protein